MTPDELDEVRQEHEENEENEEIMAVWPESTIGDLLDHIADLERRLDEDTLRRIRLDLKRQLGNAQKQILEERAQFRAQIADLERRLAQSQELLVESQELLGDSCREGARGVRLFEELAMKLRQGLDNLGVAVAALHAIADNPTSDPGAVARGALALLSAEDSDQALTATLAPPRPAQPMPMDDPGDSQP